MKNNLIKFIRQEYLFIVLGLLFAFILFSAKDSNMTMMDNLCVGDLNELYPIKDIQVVHNDIPIVGVGSGNIEEVQNVFGITTETIVAEPVDIVIASFVPPEGENGVCDSAKRTYMAYQTVTHRNSRQWKLLRGEDAWTDTKTGLRMVGDRYCIAIGQGYGAIVGDKINLHMANGAVVKCIMGDAKATQHTDPRQLYQKFDGSVVEMIMDRDYFQGTWMYPDEIRGKILKIEIVE